MSQFKTPFLCFALIFLGIVFFPKTISAFSCDLGTTSTTCYINSTQDVTGETIYGSGDLVIQNGGSLTTDGGTATTTAYLFGWENITIKNRGSLVGNFNITCSNLDIRGGSPGGKIDATGKGYGPGNGPGANRSPYGSISNPAELGSGGQGGTSGSGGGLIILNVSNLLINDGSIIANGASRGFSQPPGGGGSGGGIKIIAGRLQGSGSIRANGGHGGWASTWHGKSGGGYGGYGGKGGSDKGGGGAGGRIAIYYGTSTFSGVITANGGTGYQTGGAGTIYLEDTSSGKNELIIDNNGRFGEYTYVLGSYTFNNLYIQNGGSLYVQSGETLTALNSDFDLASGSLFNAGNFNAPGPTSLTVGGTLTVNTFSATATNFLNLQDLTINGTLTHLPNTTAKANYIDLTLSNLTISPGGKIDATGKGYGPGNGPGANRSPYGSISNPAELGSGGQGGTSGSGGGLIILNVSNLLINDGSIIANGASRGFSQPPGGGGSGGGIKIIAGRLQGSGSIRANGGHGGWASTWHGKSGGGYGGYGGKGGSDKGGGGAGGRIAIYAQDNVFNGTTTSNGGTGYQDGEEGTIYIGYPPSAINLSTTQDDYCYMTYPPVYLSWEFHDLNASDTQFAYQVQIATNTDFSSIVHDSGIVDTSGETIQVGDKDEYVPSGLSFNTNYYWRIRTWDNSNLYSDWATSSFSTGPQPPWTDFTWSPSSPHVNQIVQFADKTQFHGANSSWAWDFDNDGIIDSTAQNPTTTYSASGNFTVTLTAADSNGSCSVSTTLTVYPRIPKWQEVSPFIFW